MSKVEMFARKEKETKNFDRFAFGEILSADEEVTGIVYVPKNAKNVRVSVEYLLT